MPPVPSRRGPPKGYRRGSADPASLAPKILKIREHIQALQLAYGERLVLSELHAAIFGNGPCDVGTELGAFQETGRTSRMGPRPSSAVASTSKRSTGSSASEVSGSSTARNRGEWSQDEHDGKRRLFLFDLTFSLNTERH